MLEDTKVLGRFAAEYRFVGLGGPKIKCFFQSNRNLYQKAIHRKEYEYKNHITFI